MYIGFPLLRSLYMGKITALEFHGIDKKGGLLKECIDKAINENKQVVKGLGGGLELVVTRKSGLATFYCRNPKVKLGLATKMSLANAYKQVEELKKNNAKTKEEKTCPLLKDFFPMWLDEKSKSFKPGSNRSGNLMALYRHTLEPLHKYRLNELTPKVVFDEINSLDQTPGNKHNAVAVLSQALRNATLKGLIDVNPIADVLRGSESPFKKPKAKGYKTIPAQDLQIKYFLPLRTTPIMNRVFYLLICLTGFRFSECKLLRWSWIDWTKDLIVIPANAVGANKTQTDYFKPMTKQIRLLLEFWKTNCPDPDNDFLFKSDYSDSVAGDACFREPFKQLTSRELDFHGLRKSLKTWLVSEGGVNEFYSELALTHDVRTVLQKTYDKNSYLEGVRNALQLWNDFIEALLPEEYLLLLNK